MKYGLSQYGLLKSVYCTSIALAKRESLTKGSGGNQSRSIWGMVKSFTVSTSTESKASCLLPCLHIVFELKGKGFPCSLPSFGPELIPVYRQSARR